MADATDPNQVRLTGENSFIRLVETSGVRYYPDKPLAHLAVPRGAGHVLIHAKTCLPPQRRAYLYGQYCHDPLVARGN